MTGQLTPIAALDIMPDGTIRRVTEPWPAPAPGDGALWRWLHCDRTDAAFAEWSRAHLPALARSGLVQAETRPRFDMLDDGLVLNLRAINLNPEQAEEDMVSMRLWMTPALVVSTRYRRMFVIEELVAAMEEVRSGARLQLCGSFSEPDVEADVKQRPGWSAVDELGYLDRAAVREVLGRCVAGLVTLHPLPNYLDSQPIKMFEYMSAGIPVIASDFPLWREIVVGSQCGVCVDPMNPHEIARAIDLLVNDPERARRMGENGRAAIRDRYNWSAEERKLLRLYGELSMETRA